MIAVGPLATRSGKLIEVAVEEGARVHACLGYRRSNLPCHRRADAVRADRERSVEIGGATVSAANPDPGNSPCRATEQGGRDGFVQHFDAGCGRRVDNQPVK